MRLSYVVATPDVRGIDATAYRGPLDLVLARLRALEYDGVELMVRDPNEIDVPALRGWLDQNRLEVAMVNTGRVFLEDGIHLMLPPGEKREEARRRICAVIDFAATIANPPPRPFGAQINTGLLRGQFRPGQDRREARAWVVDNLGYVAEYARGRGVAIALEPIQRYETNFINNGQDAVQLICETGAPNLRLQMDSFHMNMEEPSISGSLIRYREHISHVHLSDTNRQAPGLGHLDFVEIIDTLQALGYEGYLSVEPAAVNQQRAAEVAVARLKPLLSRS